MTKLTSYDIQKMITTSRLFKKVKLENSTKLVLRALIDYYNADRENTYPSQLRLSEDTDLSIRTVERAIKELKLKGVIISAGQSGKHNTYKLTNLFFKFILSGEQEKNNPRQDDGSTTDTMTVDHRHSDGQTNKEKIKKHNNFKNFKNTNDFDSELASQLSDIRITETKQYLKESLNMNKKSASPLEFVEKITPHQAKVLLEELPRELSHIEYYKALEEKARQLTFAEVC